MAPSTREDVLRRLSEEVSGMTYKERKALEGASTDDIARAVSRMVTKRLKLYLLIAGMGFVGFTLSTTFGTNAFLPQSSRFPILEFVNAVMSLALVVLAVLHCLRTARFLGRVDLMLVGGRDTAPEGS